MESTQLELPQLPGGGAAPDARWSKETYIAILAILGIVAHLILRFGWNASPIWLEWPLILTLLIGGTPLLFDLARNVLKGQFGADLLAGLSIGASAALGEYLAGSIVVLMLSGGNALEQYATRRASAVLAALAKRMPMFAHRIRGEDMTDVSLNQLALGDRLVVFPHEICPVDPKNGS